MKESRRKEIMSMNLGELNDLRDFIRDVHLMNAKSSLKPGTKVFMVQKTKKTPGTIRKVLQKNAVVDMDSGRTYRIPLVMLEVA